MAGGNPSSGRCRNKAFTLSVNQRVPLCTRAQLMSACTDAPPSLLAAIGDYARFHFPRTQMAREL